MLDVSRAAVGGFAVAIIYNRDVADPARRRAVAHARTPAVGMHAARKDRRTIADGVESVQVGIVVAAAAIVVIAVGVGVITPLGITSADEDRTGVSASSAIVAGA